MSEEITQSCCNCEWLVTVDNDKACNAFQVVSDDVTDTNLCGEWEVRNVVALQERNKLTAQKVTQPFTEQRLWDRDMANDYPYLISNEKIRVENGVPIREGYTYRPYYMQPHVREELRERQDNLNKIHQVIHKIEIQKDYIINRFSIEPTQLLIDVRTLREVANHREVEHNIRYTYERKKYWRDLEIIECNPRDDQSIIEVLFLNLLV